MRVGQALSIADLRAMAKRRLPKLLFEGIESGVDDGLCGRRNELAFQDYRLLPRYLVDVSKTNQATKLLGRTYDSPFGVAPVGHAGVMRHGAETAMAAAAVAANIPIVLSGASNASIETVARTALGNTWCHVYAAKDQAITRDILRRAQAAGVDTMVLTVDVPVVPNRERNNRNGYTIPLKLSPGIILNALTHPAWMVEYFRHGIAPMESWAPYTKADATALDIAAFFRSQSPSIQTWRELGQFRTFWPGKLVVKGILHPEDATRAVDTGADAIVVSNHGGNTLDPLPSPLAMLPAVKAAVAGRIPVMFDGGIRRGTDVVIARCLGADFVLCGRAMLYGAVAGGEPGAARAIGILRRELSIALAMIGCPDFADLDQRFLIGASDTLPAPRASGMGTARIQPAAPR